jgi:hypothetical protein
MSILSEWVLQPAYFPAWLQALAALIALFISVVAIRRTGADERRRTFLELRGIAVAVYPEIGMLKITSQSVRDWLPTVKEQFKGYVGSSVAATVQNSASIAVPPMLDRYTDKLFLLGEIAGPACLHLVRMLLQYNQVVEAMAARLPMLNADEWPEALGHIEKHLTLLDAIIAKCEHEVKPIHDAVEG